MSCYRPINVLQKGTKSYKQVPCGRCDGCRSAYRADWSFRLNEELKVAKSAFFITLTYDDEHLSSSLSKRDLQLFLKRLRFELDKINSKLRYYAVGEYGSKTFRAHYHAIVFFDAFFSSDFVHRYLVSTWQKGFCQVGNVTPASINYVTKYLLKKGYWPQGLSPPFSLMSRQPGIGSSYVTSDTKRYHAQDLENHSKLTLPGGVIQRMPRYYKDKVYGSSKLMSSKLSSFSKDVVHQRSAAQKARYFKLNPTHNVLDYERYMEDVRNMRDLKLLSKSSKNEKL